MSEASPAIVRNRAVHPISEAEEAARTQAEDARTQELIRVSAEHARIRRSGGHFSQAELTTLVESIEQDLKKSHGRRQPGDLPAAGLERRRSDNPPKP